MDGSPGELKTRMNAAQLFARIIVMFFSPVYVFEPTLSFILISCLTLENGGTNILVLNLDIK